MSTEARVTELQNETSSLRKQINELKLLLEAGLDSMRADSQGQLNEAKQLLSSRESEAMSRVSRLEAEVSSLAQACERAVHTEELLLALPHPPLTLTQASGLVVKPAARPLDDLEEVLAADTVTTRRRNDPLAAEANEASMPVPQALASASLLPAETQTRLDRAFAFYTAAAHLDAELLCPMMHLSYFTTMMRDAALGNAAPKLAPPELLWMAVVRSLPASSNPTLAPARRASSMLLPRVYDENSAISESHTNCSELFTRERSRSLSQAQFPAAMRVVYDSCCPCKSTTAASRDGFLVFLNDAFLPAVERQMRRRMRASKTGQDAGTLALQAPASGCNSSGAALATPEVQCAGADELALLSLSATVAAYEADAAVQKATQQFHVQLRRSFLHAVGGPPRQRLREARMRIEAFVAAARHHHLLPLISKPQLKLAFVCALRLSAPPSSQSVDNPACIDFRSYVKALACVADLVYGREPPLQQQYPSPFARISKLYVKMFVLD